MILLVLAKYSSFMDLDPYMVGKKECFRAMSKPALLGRGIFDSSPVLAAAQGNTALPQINMEVEKGRLSDYYPLYRALYELPC